MIILAKAFMIAWNIMCYLISPQLGNFILIFTLIFVLIPNHEYKKRSK